MEVNLSAEKAARLQEFTAFVAAVEQGRASALRGNLLEHEEVVSRIEQLFGA